MEIILLESFDKLGNIGDTVVVKDGFARNYLLPQKKALRANKANKEYFEKIRQDLEKRNKDAIDNANKIAKKLENIKLVFLRQSSESGQLYGSVSPKDISNQLKTENISISPSNINLMSSVKKIGLFDAKIRLHAQVIVDTLINVASSEENAEIQMKEFLKPKETDNKKVQPNTLTDESKKEKNLDQKSNKENKIESSTSIKKKEKKVIEQDDDKSAKKLVKEINASEKEEKFEGTVTENDAKGKDIKSKVVESE
tara:strand:+ start:82563 stop:83327 length:765 start_codon:yes stop_codon:yes gene_type:complete